MLYVLSVAPCDQYLHNLSLARFSNPLPLLLQLPLRLLAKPLRLLASL